MEDNGFLVLNGRTDGDVPGQYTYLSRVGKSVVDLIWANLESCKLISELHVFDNVIVSDHLPVTLTLDIFQDEQQLNIPQSKITRFQWLPEKSDEFINLVNNVPMPDQVQNVYGELIKAIERAAFRTGMIHEFTTPNKFNINKPWYNKECRDLKKKSRKMYKKWRNENKQQQLVMFLDTKKEYFYLCTELKQKHEKHIQERLANIRNSQDFWEVVRKYKPKTPNKSKLIPIDAWSRYLCQKFSLENQSNVRSELVFTDVLREQMDSDFCIGELEKGISNLKNNKSPGPDNVLNEYLKTINENWKTHLLSFINYIFDGGSIPDTLTDSLMFMLFKKGDPNVCDNYRSIALMNNILKLITHLVSQRVLYWSENNRLFSETQAGFRPRRGCIDNIFSLHCIVSLHLINKRKLYAAFIDFKSAFSEVQHDLLFAKMFQFGISGKIITLLKKIYDSAQTQIRVEDKKTSSRRITRGVLEGDSISPIAFIIFINDLEEYFRMNGVEGVSINFSVDILLLLYCDDLIIFGSSRADLQRKLNILFSYCCVNKMKVNEAKSKVVVFRRGGRLAQTDTFIYNGKSLEVCGEYVYLGIKLSSHGVFYKAASQAVSKAKMAVSSVKNILINSRLSSHESRMKLYESIVRATLLYGAEIWGNRYEDIIEVTQCQFLKSVFCLSRSTPHYMIRLEFGAVKLSYQVLKQMLGWWFKVLSMPEERYPRICYNQLVATDQLPRNIGKYNWASLLRSKLVDLGFHDLWEAQSSDLLEVKMDEVLSKYETELVEEDYSRLERSSYCSLYKNLKPTPCTELMKPSISQYVSEQIPIDRTRVAAQIRLAGNLKVNFYLNKIGYTWNSDEQCTICNLRENEDMFHFLLKCPHYVSIRKHYLEKWLTGDQISVNTMVESPSKSDLNNLYFYVKAALKLRAFLRNE